MRTLARPLFAVLGILCLCVSGNAAVKVQTQFEKGYDFSKFRTWAWNDTGAGEVKMARTADDDPEALRQKAEPIIKEAVAAEFPNRGITAAAAGAKPDLEITYYLLVTVGTQSQQIGQFLPAVAQWGLPPLSG